MTNVQDRPKIIRAHLPASLVQELKVQAAVGQTTVQAIVEGLIRKHLGKEGGTNAHA